MKMAKKKINTLIADIYELLDHDTKGSLMASALDKFGESCGTALNRAVASPDRGKRPDGTVYASELRDFEVCPRKMWYKIHQPWEAETLLPHNRIKFLYGDLTESLLIFLAEQAGHKVTDMQAEVETKHMGITIRGRMDCKIDGELVDIKSASSPAYKRMTSPGYDPYKDMFSYHRQLQFYDKESSADAGDPYLLIMDKQLGTLFLKNTPGYDRTEMEAIYSTAHQVWNWSSTTPIDAPKNSEWVGDEDTTNGNRKLKTYCSYCPFKSKCWSDQGMPLTGYLYSYGPVWMTEVNKEPKIPRIHSAL